MQKKKIVWFDQHLLVYECFTFIDDCESQDI